MEPLLPPVLHSSSTASDPRDQIDEVLSGRVDRADIDVRTFLLDPPPTAEDVARLERRRLLVRRGSIATAAIVAVLLVAPWPSGGAGDPPVEAAPDPGVGEVVGAEPDPDAAERAIRLDTAPVTAAPPRARARRTPQRARTVAPRPLPDSIPAPPRPSPASSARPAAPARVPSSPVPVAAPAPAPAPSTGAGDAIRAPVM